MVYSNKWRPAKEPHYPPEYDEKVVYAVRALASGVANEGQQRTAFDYLMFLTGASEEFADLSYRPGDNAATSFAEGKRWVGLMLRKLMRPELTPQQQEDAAEVEKLSRRVIAQRLRRQREKAKMIVQPS